MGKLTPPDYKRCQCDITPAHGAFRLGPRPKPQQCANKPDFLAVELVAGKDGQRGSMSLCLGCAQKLMEDKELRQRVQLQPIIGAKS